MTINEKRELLFRVIDAQFTGNSKDGFISFNINGPTTYSYAEVEQLNEAGSKMSASFSHLIHQMPKGKTFEYNSNNLMWDAYQDLFRFAETKDKKFEGTNLKLSENFHQKEKHYNIFKKNKKELERELINALNEPGEDFLKIKEIKQRIKENLIQWKINGFKNEIDLAYNKQLAEANLNNIRQWNIWKERAEEADFADVNDANLVYGYFNARLDTLLENNKWSKIIFKQSFLNELIGNRIDGDISIRPFIENIDRLRFDYQIININRPWFNPAVFSTGFWQWDENYTGGKLSNGDFEGIFPSYITDIIFIKNVSYTTLSNSLWSALEWIGGFFTELPTIPFLSHKKNEIFLVAFKCTKVPDCPKIKRRCVI